MHVLLDVHVANNDQQRDVQCSIAPSHEDLHEVTPIFSCINLNSQSVSPSTVSPRMDLCSEFRPTTTDKKLLPKKCGCWAVNSSIHQIFENGKDHHNLRIHFGMHHAVLHELFFQYDVLFTFLIVPALSLSRRWR